MIQKDSISEKLHGTNVKTEKGPKIKFFDFGAFQIILQMLSHDKIIFRVWSLHDNLRILLL